MLDKPTRIQAWVADLTAINAELDAAPLPAARRSAPKRVRRRKPLWEE